MSVDHRDIPSSGTHEPKHISETTGVDAGKVITPAGGGVSELRFLTPAEVGVSFAYGEGFVDSNESSFPIPAASSADLYDTDDYVPVNSARVNGMQGDELLNTAFDPTNNTLIPSISGVYRISAAVNITCDTPDTTVGLKFRKGSGWAGFTCKKEVKHADTFDHVATSFLSTLVEGEPVGISIASDKITNVTLGDLRLSMELIREQ